jgi:L-2-hydroxyglutarate oxidase LhgO
MRFDYCVIGGGIVGLATAMAILKRQPGASLILLEKENRLAQHQTGHNSGVIHSGIYCAPGSLKADLCRRGALATKQFCREHQIPVETCGKILVATNDLELQRMDGLLERATINGIDVERLDAAALKRMEPRTTGLGGLFVQSTAIVDYRLVSETMGQLIRTAGATIELGVRVTSISESSGEVTISAGQQRWTAKRLIACAGLQSDRIARAAGLAIKHRIVPFRGEYFRLPASKNSIVQRLIYPIPDPALPFLGVHLTRMIDGGVTVGPNAGAWFCARGLSQAFLPVAGCERLCHIPGILENHGPPSSFRHTGDAQFPLESRISQRVPQVLSRADACGSASRTGRNPGAGCLARWYARSRLPVFGNRAHASCLQCSFSGGHIRHSHRGNDRG